MKRGAFTFVLHSHIPYCRRAGRWPHGEEWLHEAIAETYLPLLVELYNLHEEGVPVRLTLGITPVLAEQLADPLVLDHFDAYLQEKLQAAEGDIVRFQEKERDSLRLELAHFYRDWYAGMQGAFRERLGRDLIRAFRRLQDDGVVELLTSAATHGYLPLLERDSSIHGQLAVGVAAYQRHFGRAPRAVWLPECAYRPAFYADRPDGRCYKPGLEEFLQDLNLGLFFSETHTIEGGRPVGKATDEVVGPYGNIPRRYLVPLPEEYAEPTLRTTYLPYWVGLSEVAVIGRNNRTGMQVWSADWGYPGDGDYREFHKKDGISGLQYWRVTGPRLDLAQKDFYRPQWARYKVEQHAEHFARLVEDLLCAFHAETGRFGICASNYDTELFGHWWFEGVAWLGAVLRRLARSEVVDLTTASAYLDAHPPEETLVLPEGSWGAGGTHFTWDNPDTHWMWAPIHEAERKMEEVVARYAQASEDQALVLSQAARELLLLQASDWPFLVTTGQAAAYAVERFQAHLERFHRLADLALADSLGPEAQALAQEYFALDNVFPDLDYRVFRERERRAA